MATYFGEFSTWNCGLKPFLTQRGKIKLSADEKVSVCIVARAPNRARLVNHLACSTSFFADYNPRTAEASW
jgi:hypothetical protein